VADLVAGLAEPIAALRQQVVTEAAVKLDGARSICRVEECNLGNLIADALREETGAQITYMNGGGIRSDIEAGVITMGHILTVQPFNNVTSTFDLLGSDVLAMLENSVSRIQLNEQGQVQRGGASGRFLQISGARFSIDPTQEVGSRIVNVEVLNDMGEFEPLDPEAVYSIAGNNYVRTGGDGYSINWHVPVDDTHHWKFVFVYSRSKPISREVALRDRSEMTDDYRLIRSKANRYMQDREMMRDQSFSGIGFNFQAQDLCVTEGEGPVQDRTREHLVTSDRAIVAARKLILSGIRDVQDGGEAPSVRRGAESNRFPEMAVLSEVVPAEVPIKEHTRRRVEEIAY